MSNINLTNCFPEGKTGVRAPLPKQADFMNLVLNPEGPKYVLYCGGIGSGKTLIGCITMLTMALMYPGDYLIGRLYYPELKDTTLQQFLKILPPELIIEHRIADAVIKIRTLNNQVSKIMFRPLEEPDKLRSLNLSGFYIDESNQVSEGAFLLLQGRLRGPGIRKGFMTSNPNGHDWQYKWFQNKEILKSSELKAKFALIKAPTTENIHLDADYLDVPMQTWSADRIKREIEGSMDSFEGMIYSEFNPSIHVVKPFKIPDEWVRIIGADHGFRNHAAFIFGAVDYDSNIYIYKEFYQKEWLIEEICKGNQRWNKPGIVQLCKGEKISGCYLDPSTRKGMGNTGKSDWDTYVENLPQDFPLMLANNKVAAGIDRVKSYLKVNKLSGKPRLYIFDTCAGLLNEIGAYRYKELPIGQQGIVTPKEEPHKFNDHAMDALRYLIMSQPEPPKVDEDIWSKIKYSSLEGSLYRDIQGIKKPKIKDPFSDF